MTHHRHLQSPSMLVHMRQRILKLITFYTSCCLLVYAVRLFNMAWTVYAESVRWLSAEPVVRTNRRTSSMQLTRTARRGCPGLKYTLKTRRSRRKRLRRQRRQKNRAASLGSATELVAGKQRNQELELGERIHAHAAAKRSTRSVAGEGWTGLLRMKILSPLQPGRGRGPI